MHTHTHTYMQEKTKNDKQQMEGIIYTGQKLNCIS